MVDIYLILAVLCFNAAVFMPSGEKNHKGAILLISKSIFYLTSLYCVVVFTLITIDNLFLYLDN